MFGIMYLLNLARTGREESNEATQQELPLERVARDARV